MKAKEMYEKGVELINRGSNMESTNTEFYKGLLRLKFLVTERLSSMTMKNCPDSETIEVFQKINLLFFTYAFKLRKRISEALYSIKSDDVDAELLYWLPDGVQLVTIEVIQGYKFI